MSGTGQTNLCPRANRAQPRGPQLSGWGLSRAWLRNNQVMPSYADWVATTALALSVGGLGWQVRSTALNRPHLHPYLVLRQWWQSDNRHPQDVCAIGITNFGSAASVVSEVRLENSEKPGWTRESISHILESQRMFPDNDDIKFILSGHELPVRIGPHETVEWALSSKFLLRVEPHELWRAAIHFVKPPKLFSMRSQARHAIAVTPWEAISLELISPSAAYWGDLIRKARTQQPSE
jgi:hypothetical protein